MEEPARSFLACFLCRGGTGWWWGSRESRFGLLMEEGAGIETPAPVCHLGRERNLDRLRSRVVCQAAIWKAAISTAADLRATLAAGATGAS